MKKMGSQAMALLLTLAAAWPGQAQPSKDRPAPKAPPATAQPASKAPPATAQPASKAPPATARRGGDGLGLSPSLFELVLPPGGSKTVVMNVVFSAASGKGASQRLVASLVDWDLDPEGNIKYPKTGVPHTAQPFLTYSPSEMTARPNQSHPIRVTVTVPGNAAPGDYVTSVMIEPREANLKRSGRYREIVFRFRLAATFYVMVTPLRSKGALKSLTASHDGKAFLITPILRNDGNTHLRPWHGAWVLDASGKELARRPDREVTSLLREHELRVPIVLDRAEGPGTYQVRYRVNFRNGQPTVEGRTSVTIP